MVRVPDFGACTKPRTELIEVLGRELVKVKTLLSVLIHHQALSRSVSRSWVVHGSAVIIGWF